MLKCFNILKVVEVCGVFCCRSRVILMVRRPCFGEWKRRLLVKFGMVLKLWSHEDTNSYSFESFYEVCHVKVDEGGVYD